MALSYSAYAIATLTNHLPPSIHSIDIKNNIYSRQYAKLYTVYNKMVRSSKNNIKYQAKRNLVDF